MSKEPTSLKLTEELRREAERLLRGLSIKEQAEVLKEAEKIVQSLERIVEITSRVKMA